MGVTNTDIRNYIAPIARKTGVPDQDFGTFLDSCVKLAIIDAWNAAPWECRLKEATVSVTSQITSLPLDFAKYRSIRQREEIEGFRLYYYPKVEFDRMYPKPSAYASGGPPQAFTVYQDDGRWKLAIMPPPSSLTIYLEYYRTAPQDASEMGEEMIPVLIGAAAKYALGQIDYGSEIKRIQTIDGPVGDLGGRLLDGSDEPQPVVWAWVD